MQCQGTHYMNNCSTRHGSMRSLQRNWSYLRRTRRLSLWSYKWRFKQTEEQCFRSLLFFFCLLLRHGHHTPQRTFIGQLLLEILRLWLTCSLWGQAHISHSVYSVAPASSTPSSPQSNLVDYQTFRLETLLISATPSHSRYKTQSWFQQTSYCKSWAWHHILEDLWCIYS